MKPLRDMLTLGLLLLLFIHVLAATVSPASYGKWLQTIDNARYEHLMCE